MTNWPDCRVRLARTLTAWCLRAARVATALSLGLGGTVLAQQPVPLGSEFRVNTTTTSSQFLPSVSSSDAGGFVVVWNGPTADGSGFGVFGQRYQSTGAAAGSELPVHSLAAGDPGIPVVSLDADGDFVVVWENGFSLSARRFQSNGQSAGSELEVNVPGKDPPRSPSVSSAGNGDFIVVWTEGFAPSIRLFGRRFRSDGVAQGSLFTVDSYEPLQSNPSVSSDGTGNFVVAWRGPTQGGDNADVAARRYTNAGQALGTEFRVNTYTTGAQSYITVSPRTAAREADGDFAVVWEGPATDDELSVFARSFSSTGVAQGTEFRLNTTTTDRQVRPSVATDDSGNFIAVWTSHSQDGDEDGIFGQRFRADGQRIGSEFQVNSFTPGYQTVPAVSSDADGDFVVVWSSAGQDGSGEGIFGQRFAPPTVDLRLTLADSPDPVTAGAQLTYTITVQNLGPQPAQGLVVSSTLDPAVQFVAATVPGGQCTHSSGIVLCTLGNATPGGQAQVSVTGTVNVSAPSPVQNTATVTAPAGFRVLLPSDDTDTEATAVLPTLVSQDPTGSLATVLAPVLAGIGLLVARRRRAPEPGL